ncbi:MAG TPA: ribosome-associated translation inhibitor RaiA [Isosphaeraceae bacterium]|nr:ribosome-associated translation inhibitor RaiA [Isosphaeraceae bacterium]
MLIEISTRHGSLGPEQQAYLHEKAEKLLKYFGRLMAIEVAVEHLKNAWQVEILVSAEHKHDFVAVEQGPYPEAAMDSCVHKIENQLRRYKERVQKHRGETSAGDVPESAADIAEPPALEPLEGFDAT